MLSLHAAGGSSVVAGAFSAGASINGIDPDGMPASGASICRPCGGDCIGSGCTDPPDSGRSSSGGGDSSPLGADSACCRVASASVDLRVNTERSPPESCSSLAATN
jgi:hypothetical protein